MFSSGIILARFSAWGYKFNEGKSRQYNAVVFDFDNGKEIHFNTWRDAEEWINDVSD